MNIVQAGDVNQVGISIAVKISRQPFSHAEGIAGPRRERRQNLERSVGAREPNMNVPADKMYQVGFAVAVEVAGDKTPEIDGVSSPGRKLFDVKGAIAP